MVASVQSTQARNQSNILAHVHAGAATSLRLIIGEQSTPEHVEQTNRDAQFAPKNGHKPKPSWPETIPRVYLADLTRPVHSLELARSATTCSRVWRAVPAQTRTQ